MKKIFLPLLALAAAPAFAQFPPQITPAWGTTTVMTPSPLKTQILFVGGVDTVATLDENGKPNGFAPAKEWHDFTGFTPDTVTGSPDLGWVSINHETVVADDKIGDGGGMTVFKVRRVADSLQVVPQTLPDGRTGHFFNVEFASIVGETGMNCGGITSSFDGRIWTAEEWFRTDNRSINNAQNLVGSGAYPTAPSGTSPVNLGVRDTMPWTINTDIAGDFDGQTIQKYENFNWMVEIDPRTAKAIRKQYNWGRQGFEGGVLLPDNKTVYLGEDDTPGAFQKFVADVPGDFTKGKLYVYKHDKAGDPWIEMDATSLTAMLNIEDSAVARGATIFNRLEWVAYNKNTGKIYVTETGSDNLNFTSTVAAGGVLPPYWADAYKERYKVEYGMDFSGSDAAALDSVIRGAYHNYYGRVLEYDPATGVMRTYIEGGPFLPTNTTVNNYPGVHLSNPDGLNVMHVNDDTYLVICEDLNGRSWGRVPSEYQASGNSYCEVYMVDLSIDNPDYSDLKRVAMTPFGAEVTGSCPTPDGQTLFINAQHPSINNPAPYNHSLTVAVSGWKDLAITDAPSFDNEISFQIWPNPTARELHFNKVTDVAIYDVRGQRVRVARAVDRLDVGDLRAGTYFVRNADGETQRLVIQ